VEPLVFGPLDEEIAAEIPPGKKEEGSSYGSLYQPLNTLSYLLVILYYCPLKKNGK